MTTPAKKPIPDAQKAFGARLRQARRRRGWSLTDASRASGGISPVVIGSYERGDRAVTVVRLIQLADLYAVPAASLLPVPADASVDRAHVLEEVARELRQRAADLRGDTLTPDAAAVEPHVSEGPGS